jgi:hypothetical protein
MDSRRVLDTKTYWLTDRQSQYDLDLDLALNLVVNKLTTLQVTEMPL